MIINAMRPCSSAKSRPKSWRLLVRQSDDVLPGVQWTIESTPTQTRASRHSAVTAKPYMLRWGL
ncbi:hypothetical protein LZ30DRAFT_727832 [Colletotrichum cereale]|nr:hypothetical protein LZ30DRAFT_727832 [Colletotrichum cereale]